MYRNIPKPRDYSEQEIQRFYADGWQWRQSTRFPEIPGVGIWFREIEIDCAVHGTSKHVEVMNELKSSTAQDLPFTGCKKCFEKTAIQRAKENVMNNYTF